MKGTEFYDGKLKRYVDMPITDVLQMIGCAVMPQYDLQGVAMVLVSVRDFPGGPQHERGAGRRYHPVHAECS